MNMFLVKFWIFNIDFTTILSFLFGVVIGFVLLCLLYAVFVLASLRDKRFIIKTADDSLTTVEVKDMIVTAQKTFKDRNLRGKKKRMAFAYEIGKDLVYGIATRFYPKSKYPLLELSVDETIMLSMYIKERLEEIVNRKGVRLLKGFKIADIVNITTNSNKIIKSEAFKITKEISGVATKIKNVLNVINPLVLVRKYIIGTTINAVTDKLCVIALAIVGEETYKIYSKSVFNKTIEIESNVDEILTDIDNDFKKASNDAKKTFEENQEEDVTEEVLVKKEEPKLMGKLFDSNCSDNVRIDAIDNMPLMSVIVSEEKQDEEENRE